MRARPGPWDESLEVEKLKNDFLAGVPAIVRGLRDGKGAGGSSEWPASALEGLLGARAMRGRRQPGEAEAVSGAAQKDPGRGGREGPHVNRTARRAQHASGPTADRVARRGCNNRSFGSGSASMDGLGVPDL